MNCPNCQSDNTRRFSVIYAEGTSSATSTSKTSGTVSGYANSGSMMGAVSGSTTTQTTAHTTLAANCAPPWIESPIRVFARIFGVSIAITIISTIVVGCADEMIAHHAIWEFFGTGPAAARNFFLTMSLPMVVGLLLGIRSARRQADYNRNKYPELLSRWQRSWLCMKCGKAYES